MNIDNIGCMEMCIYSVDKHLEEDSFMASPASETVEIIHHILADELNKLGVYIIEIDEYEFKALGQRRELFADIANVIKDSDKYLLTTYVHIVRNEFPRDEYNMPFVEKEDPAKKTIPYYEIMDRDSKMLEDLGFVGIEYVNGEGVERLNPFIYPNKIGKMVIDYIHDNGFLELLDKYQE